MVYILLRSARSLGLPICLAIALAMGLPGEGRAKRAGHLTGREALLHLYQTYAPRLE